MIKSLIVVWLSMCTIVFAQEANTQNATDTLAPSGDTTSIVLKKHSPVKASIYSMVVPGLGQVYNKKYWKVPLAYIGIGLPFYFSREEHKDFKKFRSVYRNRIAGDSTDNLVFTNDNLLDFIDTHRRNRDLLIIVSSIIYVLNIVDASVDAHFFYYNVTEDLSLRIRPSFYRMAYSDRPDNYVKGFSLNFEF